MEEKITNTIYYFDEEGIKNAFEKLGWKFNKKGYVLDGNGVSVKCVCCKTPITKTELSAFSPGSVNPLCSDIRCYMVDMLRRERMR